MARSYRPTTFRRVINRVLKPLAKHGLAGRHVYVLAVPGRKTGKRYETPVNLIEDGDRWLVAAVRGGQLGPQRAGGRRGRTNSRARH